MVRAEQTPPPPEAFHYVLETMASQQKAPDVVSATGSPIEVSVQTPDLTSVRGQLQEQGVGNIQQDVQVQHYSSWIQQEMTNEYQQFLKPNKTANSFFGGLLIATIGEIAFNSAIAPAALHAVGMVAPVLAPIIAASPVGIPILAGIVGFAAIRTVWGITSAIRNHQAQPQAA